MAKELYLYSGIYDFVAENLIQQMNEADGEDIVIRVNSPGGNVFAGWGIIAKMAEHTAKVNLKVDGAAMSMAAVLPLYATSTEALDVSTFMLHRADMYVDSPEDQAFLDKVNKDLRSKMQAKINDEALIKLKGVGIKNLFEDEKRIDLFLTAKEAKQIGLITKINKIDPKEASAFNDRFMRIAAEQQEPPKIIIQKQTKKAMTRDEIKAQHPDIYAQIVAEGVAKERDRVGAWATFVSIDPEAVAKGIKEGGDISQTAMAEFSFKKLSADSLTKLGAEAVRAVTTAATEAGKTPEALAKEKELADFEKEVDAYSKKLA
jgi:ATP-dependent protease ClpP protease subunit